jgi:hypothetical protein
VVTLESSDRLGLHRRKDGGIGIEGDADAGVSEAFRDHLGMNPLEQHEGGVAVA